MQVFPLDSPATKSDIHAPSEINTQVIVGQPWTVVFRKADSGALWKITAVADSPDDAVRAVVYDQDLSSDRVLAVIDPHSLR